MVQIQVNNWQPFKIYLQIFYESFRFSVFFFSSSFCLSHTLVFLLHLNGFSSATHKENEQWNFKIVDFEWKHQVFNYKKRIRNHWFFSYKLINCKGTQPNNEKREYIMQLFGLFIKRVMKGNIKYYSSTQ